MRTIKTYKELRKYVQAFSKKNINLLIIISRSGLGKSTIAEEELIGLDPLLFKGHLTPLQLYRQIYLKNEEEKDFILILDDVDSLLTNKINITLLKQICETREDKMVFYSSTTPLLKYLKPQFETSCKVIILLNDISTFSENPTLKALISRSHIINFDPTPAEILEYLAKYAKDKQILDFIQRYSPFSQQLDLRVYEKARELKRSKLDWKDVIITELEIDERLVELDSLMKKYNTDIERIQNFNGSRMTFYRTKKRLLEKTKTQ